MTIPNASLAAPAETLTLIPRDGVPITALRYAARGTVRGHLVVAGATGVPQLFYRAFAEFASACGYTTLTLDYRGIGLSRPASLKGFRMAYLEPPPSTRWRTTACRCSWWATPSAATPSACCLTTSA